MVWEWDARKEGSGWSDVVVSIRLGGVGTCPSFLYLNGERREGDISNHSKILKTKSELFLSLSLNSEILNLDLDASIPSLSFCSQNSHSTFQIRPSWGKEPAAFIARRSPRRSPTMLPLPPLPPQPPPRRRSRLQTTPTRANPTRQRVRQRRRRRLSRAARN